VFIYKYSWLFWICQRFNFLHNPEALFICSESKATATMMPRHI